MFDFGFSELLVAAIVALIVLGPERLPKAARFVGLWVRRARAQWYSVKSELESELADDELKRSLQRMQDELQDARARLRDGGVSLQRELGRLDQDPNESEPGAQQPPPPGPREPATDEPPRRDPGNDQPTRREPGQPSPEKPEPDPRTPDQPDPPRKRLSAADAASAGSSRPRRDDA